MKLRSIALRVVLLVLITVVPAVRAAAVPVTVEVTSIRDIQSYEMGQNATDQVYLLLTGTAAGKAIDTRLPQGNQTLPAGPKQPAVSSDKPITLWKGDLDANQYVLLTVTLMQGKGQDQAKNQKFIGEIQSA